MAAANLTVVAYLKYDQPEDEKDGTAGKRRNYELSPISNDSSALVYLYFITWKK